MYINITWRRSKKNQSLSVKSELQRSLFFSCSSRIAFLEFFIRKILWSIKSMTTITSDRFSTKITASMTTYSWCRFLVPSIISLTFSSKHNHFQFCSKQSISYSYPYHFLQSTWKSGRRIHLNSKLYLFYLLAFIHRYYISLA